MIYYDHLPLSEEILDALAELHIDYVFQPIFYPDGKTIYAREALMRPHEMTVTELIDKYAKENKLHILEVATIFGATQAHILRGYSEKVTLNSFPSECFYPEEQKAFSDYYGQMDCQGIIEILEYPEFSSESWEEKKKMLEKKNMLVAVDDYGCGNNDDAQVEYIQPQIVKLDRSLITGIDKSIEKQRNIEDCIKRFHKNNQLIIAEGIETKEDFDYLVGLGVDLFQGYYLARPA